MPTIKELEAKITELETKALETAVLVAELEKRPTVEEFEEALASDPKAVPETVEKQVKLAWPHSVDTATGAEPSAFGVKLTMVGKKYFGTMSESRAEVELSRKGKSFTKP